MFELPQCTPYWGILAEAGIWPITHRIEYKKLMIFQNIIQSEEKRLIKEIIEDQIRAPYSKCWGKSILEICEKYNVRVQEIRDWTKMQFKREIKKRINERIEKELEEKKKDMKKLRFTNGVNKMNYINELKANEAITVMKTRLNMLDLKANYRGKYNEDKCELCKSEEDNTEHLFACEKLKCLIGHDKMMSVENINTPTSKLSKYIDQAMLIKSCVRLGEVDFRTKYKALSKGQGFSII